MHLSPSIAFSSFLFGVIASLFYSAETRAEDAPAPPIGKAYFVRTDGNDANDGLSDATAWRTTAKVNSAVTAIGSDVYFKAGGIWDDQTLTVDWDGTSSDHVIIGSYYMSGGQALQLTPDNPSAYPSDYTYSHGARAQINGTYDERCSPVLSLPLGSGSMRQGNPTCLVDVDGAVPTSTYAGLINIRCNYCDVQNMHLRHSAGTVLYQYSITKYKSGYRDHRYVNNLIERSAATGILVGTSRNDYIHGNVVSRTGAAGGHGDGLGSSHGGAIIYGTISAESNNLFLDTNTLIEKNDIINNYQEGFFFSKVGRVILRGNRFGNNTDISVYIHECEDCVLEYNVVWGGTPFSNTQTAEWGIGLYVEADEGSPHTRYRNVTVRGNVVSNQDNGLKVGAEPLSFDRSPALTFENIRIYNNTFVNLKSGIDVSSIPDDRLRSFEFKNNIVYNESGGRLCNAARATHGAWDYNFWGMATDPNCAGPNDTIGNPMLTGSGFNTKSTITTPPTLADYVLQAGSPALARGTPLDAATLTSATYPIGTQVTYPCATFDLKGSVMDAACGVRNPTHPALGALQARIQARINVAAEYVLTVE